MAKKKRRTDWEQKIAGEHKIRIGNLVIQLNLGNPADEGNQYAIPRAYERFVIKKGTPDIIIHIHQGEIPELDVKEKERIFDWGGPLSLYRSNGKLIVPFVPNGPGPRPSKVAIFGENFEQGDIYLPPEYSLQHDLDEFLVFAVINLLGLGRGILVHACGIIKEDKGLVFAGTSGAGKSTMANLWKVRNDVTILGDDRLIIGKENGAFLVYGTVWHSDAEVCSPESVLLEKMYFIEHASKNYVWSLKGSDPATRLLVRTFPPLFDTKGMQHTLSFCAELTENVPTYELGFVPDRNIVDFVEEHLEGGDVDEL